MSSLRARVLLSVLTLAAAGLLALATVTYTEQRSFLQGRLNQEVEGAEPAVSHRLDELEDEEGAGANRLQGHAQAGQPRGFGPTNGNPNLSLPPGTYGQRREASGKVLHHTFITFGQTAPAAPKLPAQVPLNKLFTVDSVGSSGLEYRVYAHRDPEDSGITVVAVPLREVDDTLSHLLLVEALVIVAVLLALAVSASFVVRLGLRPLDRMEVTAGEIAGGDELSKRVSPSRPTSVRGSGSRSTRCSTASSRRSPHAKPARSDCASSSRTPRTSCARRWPRFAATPSCFAWAQPLTPAIPRPRCGASRKSRGAWACSSRTC
jgi:two-component system OmpR family sensor kinase